MRRLIRIFKIGIIISIIFIGYLYVSFKYPLCYKDTIIEKSKTYKLDPYLVASIINVESGYDKNAISRKDAKGLMQISPQTGKWASEVLGIDDYDEEKLFDSQINIEIGSWYLNRLFKEFDGDLDLVLMSYNAGSGNVNKWLNDQKYSNDGKSVTDIPFEETKNYLVKVKSNYKIYKFFYEKNIIKTKVNDSHMKLITNIKKKLKVLMRQ